MVAVGITLLPQERWASARRRWQQTEEWGFDHAWTYDHLAWRSLVDEPWFATVPLLAAAAAVTERIGLGTWVASPNFRHPVPFAKDVMGLDDISGGRFLLGVGAGSEQFLGWAGLARPHPLGTTAQAVANGGHPRRATREATCGARVNASETSRRAAPQPPGGEGCSRRDGVIIELMFYKIKSPILPLAPRPYVHKGATAMHAIVEDMTGEASGRKQMRPDARRRDRTERMTDR